MFLLSDMAKEKILVTKVEPTVADLFIENCKSEGKTVNKKLGELIEKENSKAEKTFLAGKNKIIYQNTLNSFKWYAELDNGEKIELLNNLSSDFLENLKLQIEKAQRDRNDWLSLKEKGSVEIPNFKGDKNE